MADAIESASKGSSSTALALPLFSSPSSLSSLNLSRLYSVDEIKVVIEVCASVDNVAMLGSVTGIATDFLVKTIAPMTVKEAK